MILFIKGLIGALIVILISIISRTKNYYIAGLIPLFPTFALIAAISVGVSNGSEELKKMLLFGMLSLIPYFLYLVSVYFLINYYSLFTSLFLAIFVWLLFAFILIFLWNK